MKVKDVTFYQSVRLPADKAFETHRVHPTSAETRGCEIVFHKGCVVVSHSSWKSDCVVGLANIRCMNLEKGEFLKTEAPKEVEDVKPKATKTK